VTRHHIDLDRERIPCGIDPAGVKGTGPPREFCYQEDFDLDALIRIVLQSMRPWSRSDCGDGGDSEYKVIARAKGSSPLFMSSSLPRAFAWTTGIRVDDWLTFNLTTCEVVIELKKTSMHCARFMHDICTPGVALQQNTPPKIRITNLERACTYVLCKDSISDTRRYSRAGPLSAAMVSSIEVWMLKP
jgi:hypothetical protein